MKNMRFELIQAFPSVVGKELSDEYIETHPELMWDIPSIPLIRAVPLYMLWCVEHADDEGSLIFDYTIQALNKYARARQSNNDSQNFKFQCNCAQLLAVQNFLNWCQKQLKQDYEPSLSRAIKNWSAVTPSA